MLATNTRPRARARKRNGLKGAAKMLTRQPQTGRGRLAQPGQSTWLRTKLSRVQILQRPLLTPVDPSSGTRQFDPSQSVPRLSITGEHPPSDDVGDPQRPRPALLSP